MKLDRFVENIHFIIKDMGYITPCYIWIKSLDNKGYAHATIAYPKSTVRVHRYLYILKHGPQTLELDHKCNNRACINDEHLEPVTTRENAVRGFARGTRTVSGSILINKSKTHCPHGHIYDENNTYITKQGHRQCKICRDKRNKSRIFSYTLRK